jgi:proteasome lid subunit RPN8/RPN11
VGSGDLDPLTNRNHPKQYSSSRLSVLRLHITLWRQMLQDVINKAPQEEACGLLTGRIHKDYYLALQVHHITNQLHSSTRYYMAPEEIISVFTELEQKDDELIGIYHSHINGPKEPSETDIKQAYYPECIYLIWSPLSNTWDCRGYRIIDDQVSYVKLVIN